MTAATPQPPGDGEGYEYRWQSYADSPSRGGGEVCRGDAQCPASVHEHGCFAEPPAADSPTPGTETPWDPQRPVYNAEGFLVGHHRRVAPSPVDTTEPQAEMGCRCPEVLGVPREHIHIPSRPPAATQQDDEREIGGRWLKGWVLGSEEMVGWLTGMTEEDRERFRAAFNTLPCAARPAADAETLRDALLDVLGAVDELLRQPADETPRGALAAARDRARRCLDRLSR